MLKKISLFFAFTISSISLSSDTNNQLIKKTVTYDNTEVYRLLADDMMQSIVDPNKSLAASSFKKYNITPEMVRSFLQACKYNKGTMLYAYENEDFLNRYLHAQKLGSPSSYIVHVPGTITKVPVFALMTIGNATGNTILLSKALAQNVVAQYQNVSQFKTANEKEVRELLDKLDSLKQNWNDMYAEIKKEYKRVVNNSSTERTKLLQNQKPASKKCRCSCTIL